MIVVLLKVFESSLNLPVFPLLFLCFSFVLEFGSAFYLIRLYFWFPIFIIFNIVSFLFFMKFPFHFTACFALILWTESQGSVS